MDQALSPAQPKQTRGCHAALQAGPRKAYFGALTFAAVAWLASFFTSFTIAAIASSNFFRLAE
jgi:hypothetical protein